jgi:ubiquinol-cytochrome c reductase cytochrome c1 subunit
MSRRVLCAAALAAAFASVSGPVGAADDSPSPPREQWSFDGPFGTYDRASVQRGYQIYTQVCSACHPVKHLHFRDLTQIGYSEDEVKAFAAAVRVTDGPNDQGKMYQRPGRPSDPIPDPFPNDQAARASNNGALPPDQSLIVKAREGGPDYVYAILTGYTPAPAGFQLPSGMYYNKYFLGHQIAMPPPLAANSVTFADGTPATLPQMAHDIVTFLNWASEPELETRHRAGFAVFFFLIVTAGLLYAVKRKIWARLH